MTSRHRHSPPPTPDGIRLRDIERAAVERTLEMTGNNQSEAARILGIARPTLLRKLKSYRDDGAVVETPVGDEQVTSGG